MASYEVEISTTAAKQLRKLAKKDRARVVEAIAALAARPRPRGVRKLQGYEDIYRLRVGRHRVIYEIIDNRLVVIVLKLGHRKDVYR